MTIESGHGWHRRQGEYVRSILESNVAPRSTAFIRIKADVLGIVRNIPPGRLCTYAAIGRHLDVMARQVA